MKKAVFVFKKYQSEIFCAVIVILLIIICIPLFAVARYNYMSADDFGYGYITHLAIVDGQPWKIFGLAAQQAAVTYQIWQGSFSAIFLFALHPGIWGEEYYRLGIYIILAFLTTTQFACFFRLQGKELEPVEIIRLVSLCTLLYLPQIFYAPYPVECFYWFNGSLYYTIFYSLQILLFSETLVLLHLPERLKGKHYIFWGWMLCLAVIIGGGNLATALSTSLALCLLCIGLFVKKHPRRFHIYAVTAFLLAAFVANIIAPGNAIRGQDPGYHPMSPVHTVLLAIWHCMTNIYSWTRPQMCLILLIAGPLLWNAAGVIRRNRGFSFRFPLIASILFFGIYAAQLAPITYMEGTFGPPRMGDMMWFSYVFLMFVVEGYWLGWFQCRFMEGKHLKKGILSVTSWYGLLQLVCLAVWCISVLSTNVKMSGTYKAWAAVRSGDAQKYAAENEERLKILLDPSITDVCFQKIEHRVEPIFFVDIGENSEAFENIAMAKFYRKNKVAAVEE